MPQNKLLVAGLGCLGGTQVYICIHHNIGSMHCTLEIIASWGGACGGDEGGGRREGEEAEEQLSGLQITPSTSWLFN